MADNPSDPPNAPQRLELPTVTALRQEARRTPPGPSPMIRTISEDIREEREDLKEAAEQSLNVILDLSIDGRINWVSPSWVEVIGTPIEEVEGKYIRDLIVDNKSAFENAVESMKEDDSRSQIVRFAVKTGPSSVFRSEEGPGSVEGGENNDQKEPEPSEEDKDHADENVISLEAQGIMVYEKPSGDDSHTMWMIRPSTAPREVTIGLPPLLVESLGVGAEVLANYLTELAEEGVEDPEHHPPPMPVLCRICERQITPWWFEKHSELCLQEHRSEMDVQLAQENLNEHRHVIVKVLDALETRRSRQGPADIPNIVVPQAEYKGLPIGPTPSTSSSAVGSGSSSSSGTPPRSRDPSATGMGHTRARSFAVRRPLTRIVELVLDLCDTALEISTPALKESRTEFGDELRTQSPQSESRISQVLGWQSPSSNTLDQEQGLAALSADTENVARAKVEAVFRHRRIVEYAERIRVEFAVLVEECIAAAMNKADRIVAGDLDDSPDSCSDAENDNASPSEQEDRTLSQSESHDSVPSTSTSATGTAPGLPFDQALRSQLGPGSSSVAVSTRSSSPMECPTPRSHKSLALLSHSQPTKRGSLLAESDPAESDSSVLSSILSTERRTESPSSERGISRTTSSRDRKRRSLILPGMSSSPRRESPARPPPQSPLRMSKPRLSTGESVPSPTTSPLLSAAELGSHNSAQFYPPPFRHHRRQSSTNSPEFGKTPVSPHLSSVSHPPPRAVTPSIKDFEIIKPISKGAFGSVYLSKKKSTAEYFAIKVLKKTDMVAKNQITNVKAERAIMMWQGESDFVAKLYWTFSSKDYLYLVMEYLNGGDCASLVKILGGLPEDWAKKYIAEVVLGVEHLHNRGIVHRDLKPDNLLIDQKGHLKLTDFGLSRMGLVGRQKRLQKSPNDQAPDLLKHGPFIRTTASLTSSRSASFDYPTQSPNSTPLIAPDAGTSQPSYFSLNKELPFTREHSRRASGYRSDSGSSDTLSAMFRSCSLYEPGDTPYPMFAQQQQKQQQQQLSQPPSASIEEEVPSEAPSEASDSPYLLPIQPSLSHQTSSSGHHGTPPPSLMPPAMSLFDPEDHNRVFVGTPDYLAPETIKGSGQDEMCDWWTMGCILFEFLYGYPPFNADTPAEVFQNILNRRINWPEEADELSSPEARDMINRLMTMNPDERLGSNSSEAFTSGGEEIRNHSWFSDVNWDTLLEDEAQFVPAPENPEDTEYFDARGATLQAFTEELEDQFSPPAGSSSGEYPDRPHDALYKARTQMNSLKRGLIPLHIPPHVRDSRSRRLSEPVASDDFGNFNFKNLPILERANKDVIQKLRQEAMQAQQRTVPAQTPAAPPGPSLEGSPLLPMPLKRTMSHSKAGNRPVSPSNFSQANSSSPSRPSQPSSPLLVQFSTGQHHHERRKTSGSSSTFSQQSSSSLQPGGFEPPRLATNLKTSASAASSPIKHSKMPVLSPESQSSIHRQSSAPLSRPRSQTLGSQDSDMAVSKDPFVPGHRKRRSQLFDISPSSSDNEDPRAKALLKVQRRRQSSRRLSQINVSEGPFFRPLDVLICEDHPVSRMVMERLFEKLRCRTITAVNGSEAMRFALSEVQFDIIMTEFKLPQINGADVARMVRDTKSVNTHTPIIAVTGYLKDLPETHHFDALIEKPPTLTKLTEALTKFCQWKSPPKDGDFIQPTPIPASALRHVSLRSEDSPSSTSSAFATVPTSSYRGSSRTESISSSYFGDPEPSKSEDVPIIVNRQPTDEWTMSQSSGLGISEEPSMPIPKSPFSDMKSATRPPTILQPTSAPPVPHAGVRTPRRHSSLEGIRAKRESLEKKRYEGAESGDDEDEELGNVQARAKIGPQTPSGKPRRSGSKLGTEMLRTNSRGSVVSTSEEPIRESGAESVTSSTSTKTALGDVMTTNSIEAAVEQMHLVEEVLEPLPEVPEKEESSSSSDKDNGGKELEGYKTPPQALGEIEEKESVTMTSHITDPEFSMPQTQLEPTPQVPSETQEGSLTPPNTLPEHPKTTPEVHKSLQAVPSPVPQEDTDATPRPTPAGSNPNSFLGAASEGDADPTPRAESKHQKFDRVMGWIRR